MTRKRKIILTVIAAVLLAVVIWCGIYVSDYYHADSGAAWAMVSDETVTVEQTENFVAFSPAEPVAGFVFYPGGKVEYTAYAPLMRALAQRDILCVVVRMPFNLAVLDINAAEGIPEQFPEVGTWYIGGHSLGGSMAASYVADNADAFDGLALLAAYSTSDLTNSGLEIISVYGNQDGVLDMEKYEKYRKNLPETAVETVIEGGNHAQFGNYGTQSGDGEAAISAEEQIKITADILAEQIDQ